MKLTFYVDIFSLTHQKQHGFLAVTSPSKKVDGATRWAFDVTIPDDKIYEADAYVPEATRPRIVGDSV